ncbi:MAG: glutathione S-transferase family protein [Pseudomonadota bacterium]
MAAILLREYKPNPALVKIAEQRSADVAKRSPEGLKLYALGSSICSLRARLAIEEKQLAYEEHTLDFSISENLEPWYLDLNPRGVVPTIVEGGEALFDSYTIMLYVNNRFTGPELTPDGDADYAAMIALMREADHFPIRDFAYRWEKAKDEPDLWRICMFERVKAFMEKYPDYAEIYEKKLKDYESMDAVSGEKASMKKLERDMNATMDGLDQRLSEHEWLVGDAFSLADIAWLPVILRIQIGVAIEIFSDSLRPNLKRFVEQCMARPSFNAAVLNRVNDLQPQMDRLKAEQVA